MKLFKYIILIIVAGLILLRLLYINAFGSLHIPHVDDVYIVAGMVVFISILFAFYIDRFREKVRNEKNDIWDALCALRDGHNDNHNEISKLLSKNKELTDEIKDLQKSLDSLYRTENQAKDNIINN